MSAAFQINSLREIIENINTGKMNNVKVENFNDQLWKEIIIFIDKNQDENVEMVKVFLVLDLMRKIALFRTHLAILEKNITDVTQKANESVTLKTIFLDIVLLLQAK